MAHINVLDFEIANRIAAGEVVDRPASVLKELLENAIDAGATSITAEIRGGGVAMIRVADNGCGMEAEDLPLALKRHATSKIKTAEDLDAIGTLGFRGEALAAISSVSRVTMVSKTKSASSGTLLVADNGRVVEVSEVGCADGTTVTVEELFRDVPARRKFLKKDVTEAMACTSFVEKVALSRPDISFRMVVDGALKFSTAGDGKVQDAIYALLGREIATRLLPVEGETGGVCVRGFIGRSDAGKNSRNWQNFFINGRYVRSKTVMAALERAFSSYMAPGKFPVAVLYLSMENGTVDVNVHPAKLEVKFSNEHAVFEAVYYAVKGVLDRGAYRPEMDIAAVKGEKEKVSLRHTQLSASIFKEAPKSHADDEEALWRERLARAAAESKNPIAPPRTEGIAPKKDEVTRPVIGAEKPVSLPPRTEIPWGGQNFSRMAVPKPRLSFEEEPQPVPAPVSGARETGEEMSSAKPDAARAPSAAVPSEVPPEEKGEEVPTWRVLGVAFDTYILVEMGSELLVIDQHAAHERLIFEELKAKRDLRVTPQALLVPLAVTLSSEELAMAREHREKLREVGFEYAVTETGVLLSTVPDEISVHGAAELFTRMVASLFDGGDDPTVTEAARREKLLYQVACKAAIKGGRQYGHEQTEELVRKLLAREDITVCPHGRPVAFRLTRKELEKQFERI